MKIGLPGSSVSVGAKFPVAPVELIIMFVRQQPHAHAELKIRRSIG